MHGGRANASRIHIIVRRLVHLVVVLNLLVVALLVAVTFPAGGGGSAVADDTGDAPEVPVTVAADPDDAPEAAADVEAGDVDDVEVDDGDVEIEDVSDSGDTVGDVATPPEPDDEPVVATAPPPYPDPFEPTINEVQADAKRLGTMAAYVITNYDVDSSLADVLATLPTVSAEAEGLSTSTQVQTVHHPGMWSRGTVEYAQLGGHLDGRISIIVVVRQDLGVDGSGAPERTEKRTMDVRLVRGESGAWEFEGISSAGGEPVERPADLGPLAAAVVDNDRIDLPDTGKWDIYAGYIDPAVLQVMHDIAAQTPYGVVVLQTGHSYNVFGTNRVSNHSVGRAVDIYRLESELVIDSHDPASAIYALSEWLVSRRDVKEFGSPWRFTDAVAHTFTNEVHHDHLHIGMFPGAWAED